MVSRNQRLSIYWVKLLVTALFFSPAWAQQAKSDLSILRFYSSTDTRHALVAVYERDAQDLWRPQQVGRLNMMPVYKPTCDEALLDHLQTFSLNVMAGADYLKEEDFRYQEELTKKISPEQVTFLEMSRRYPISERAQMNLPAWKVSPVPDEYHPENFRVRTGGLWIISGQAIFPFSHDVWTKWISDKTEEIDLNWNLAVPVVSKTNRTDFGHNPFQLTLHVSPLPWQYSSYLWESNKLPKHQTGDFAEIDRNKYKLIWELGRAAQVEPDQFETMVAAAVAVIYQELITGIHGRVEDAFVFAKALDANRMRRFRRGGFQMVEELNVPGHGYLMMAPLAKLLEKFPYGANSARSRAVNEAFQGKLDQAGLFTIQKMIQTNFRTELDFLLPKWGLVQKSPVVLHDLSLNYKRLLMAALKLYGRRSDAELKSLQGELAELRNDFSPNLEFIREKIPIEAFFEQEFPAEAVRLTNLDTDLNRDPRYIPYVLMGTLKYLKYRYHELGMNGENEVRLMKTKIAIQTTSFEIFARALQLGGTAYPRQILESGGNLYTISFDIEQIAKLQREYPLVDDYFQQGFWFFRGINASPLVF